MADSIIHLDQERVIQPPNSNPGSWSLYSGTPPATVLPSGLIHVYANQGTVGDYSYTLALTDSSGNVTTYPQPTFSILADMVITPDQTLYTHDGFENQTAAITVTNAYQGYSLALSGSLPTGISFNSSNGVFTIQDDVAKGSYQFTVTATDQTDDTVSCPVTINVLDPLTIDTPTVTQAKSNSGATIKSTPHNPHGTTTFGLSSTVSGISFDASTGYLTVGNASPGTYTFKVTVTDDTKQSATTDSFSITILPPFTIAPPPDFQSHSNSRTSGVAPTSANGTAPIHWAVSGSLPSGLTVDPDSGVVTADHVVQGSYEVDLIAFDSTGVEAVAAPMSVTVLGALGITVIPSRGNTRVPRVINPIGMVHWDYSGNLPSGITFDSSSGRFIVAPGTVNGTYSAILIGSDDGGGSSSTTISIVVPINLVRDQSLLLWDGCRMVVKGRMIVKASVPANLLTHEDGMPFVTQRGNYIATEG